jgi:hypothetical protein
MSEKTKILNKMKEFAEKYNNPNDLLSMVEQSEKSGDVSYGDLINYMHINILSFCGCGNPYDNIEFVANGLELIKEHRELGDSLSETREESIKRFGEYKKAREEFFGGDRMANFMLYWLDANEFTEHGSGVGGSWIDEKGYDFLELFEMLESLTDSE